VIYSVHRSLAHASLYGITFAEEVMFCLCLFVCQQDNSESRRRLFGWVGRVSDKRLDFDDDPGHTRIDSGILKMNFYHCGIYGRGSCTNAADSFRIYRIFMNFSRVRCFTNSLSS